MLFWIVVSPFKTETHAAGDVVQSVSCNELSKYSTWRTADTKYGSALMNHVATWFPTTWLLLDWPFAYWAKPPGAGMSHRERPGYSWRLCPLSNLWVYQCDQRYKRPSRWMKDKNIYCFLWLTFCIFRMQKWYMYSVSLLAILKP